MELMDILFHSFQSTNERGKEMHKLIRIDEAMATRFLVLKNLESGIVERCFDDTPWLSDDNFEFMLVNQEYNCKIKLFGDAVEGKTEDSVLCRVINRDVVIGRKPMVQVEVDSGQYYIPQNTIKDYLDRDSFYFECMRKDLIQVNDVINPGLL